MFKRLKRIVFFIFFLTVLTVNSAVFCQNHLAVDIERPIYDILEIAEIKGAIKSLPQAKPYSCSTIIRYLKMAYENRNILSSRENAIIKDFLETYNSKKNGLIHGNLHSKGNMGDLWIGINESSDFRLNFNKLEYPHMHNLLKYYIKGNIGQYFSYYGGFGFTYDKVGLQCFTPYSFTKKWDGFHIGFGEPRYSLDGNERVPYFSFVLDNDIAAQFFNDNLALSFSRFRRDWGIGEGSLYLSESARPFQGIEIHARLTSWLNFSYTVGSLANWLREGENIPSSDSYLSFQKMFTAQMFEIFPCQWFYISAVGLAVWAKRFELGYLNPLMYPIIHQNLHGDFDNVALAINMAFRIPKYAKIYFSFFVDEMEFTSFKKMIKRPRNMFAYQAGINIPIPRLPFTNFTFQYTKLEPFVYTHYPEEHLTNTGDPVDMTYTHDNENLGYHLPPNSDEFLIKLESMFISNLTTFLKYQLIRHGTNDPDITGDLAIYGDVNIPFNYDKIDEYPDKNFLHDGIYDWNNIVTLGASYTFPKYPITLSAQYSISHTFWVVNNSGVNLPENVIKNILVLKINIFR